jgi:DNA invertase Pin-like site-specific DNA recombinase
VQLAGHDFLKREGITLVPATSPDHFVTDTPTAVLVRQVLGAIAQFEKAALVARMKVARDRKVAQGIKCGGRRAHAEIRPDVVALAKQLRRKPPRGPRPSLREVSRELAAQGHVNALGRPFSAASVRNMVGGQGGRDEATRRGLRAAKTKGKRLGNPNIDAIRGLAVAATKAISDRYAGNTLPIVRQIQASGAKSLREIARALHARGVPTARGGQWTPVQVTNLLKRAV